MRKKYIISLFMVMLIFLSACGEKEQSKIKIKSGEKSNEKQFKLCEVDKKEYTLDLNDEMVIDFLCYKGELELYSFGVELNASNEPEYYMIKRDYNSEITEKTKVDNGEGTPLFEIEQKNTSQRIKRLTKLNMDANGDVLGLWQEYKVDTNDIEGKKTCINRGIIKMERDSKKIIQIVDNLISDDTINYLAEDFTVNEVGEFVIYFPENQSCYFYNESGELRETYDLSKKMTGKLQFHGNYGWAVNKDMNAIIRFDSVNSEDVVVFDKEMRDNRWFVCGNDQNGYALVDSTGAYQIENDKLRKVKMKNKDGFKMTKTSRAIVSDSELLGFVLDQKGEVDNVWENIHKIQIH